MLRASVCIPAAIIAVQVLTLCCAGSSTVAVQAAHWYAVQAALMLLPVCNVNQTALCLNDILATLVLTASLKIVLLLIMFLSRSCRDATGAMAWSSSMWQSNLVV
jgi:hypothetical protein